MPLLKMSGCSSVNIGFPRQLSARPILLGCLALVFSTLVQPVRAQPIQSVLEFTESLIESSLSIRSSNPEPDEEARRRFYKIAINAFDMRDMARFALGGAWDLASKEQRSAYLAAFEGAVVSSYVKQIWSRRGMQTVLLGVRPDANGQQLSAVRVIAQDMPEEVWIFRLRPHGQTWRVVDVIVNGSSAMQSERANFSGILESNNNDIAEVIKYIHKRTPRW